jgi:hypothetical protein
MRKRWYFPLLLVVVFLLSFFSAKAAKAAEPVRADISIGTPRSYALWYEETFSKGSVAEGKWDSGPYTTRISPYHGYKERNTGPVVFNKNLITVQDGKLRMWGHKRLVNGVWTTYGAGIVPLLGGKYVGLKYGYFEVSLEFIPQGSLGMQNWWFAGLLWPQTNEHRDGEVDFVEGVPGTEHNVWQHKLGYNGVNPQETCYYYKGAPGTLLGKHTYGVEWLPERTNFYRDGVLIGSTNCMQPTGPELMKLQLVSLNRTIDNNSHGLVLVDDIRIWKLQ